jgi:hypothetical protein
MATVNGKDVTVVSTGAFSVTCRGPRGGRVVLLKCKVNGVWMVSQNGKAEKLSSHSGFDLPQETTEEKVKRLFPLAEVRAVANGFQKPGTAQRTIPVEDIIAIVKEHSLKDMYQEDLCQSLHRSINACCVLVGYHSGIRVTSQCGELQ